MLKKLVALTCAALVSTVLVFGLTGCSENKPAAPAGGSGAAPTTTDHATTPDTNTEKK